MTTGAGLGPLSGTAWSAITLRSSRPRDTLNAGLPDVRQSSADAAVRQGGLCACEHALVSAMVYSAGMVSGNDDPAGGGTGDFDALARRYLDLWQGQLAGLAADQALTEQIARLFAAANAQVASAIQAAQGAHHASQAGT